MNGFQSRDDRKSPTRRLFCIDGFWTLAGLHPMNARLQKRNVVMVWPELLAYSSRDGSLILSVTCPFLRRESRRVSFAVFFLVSIASGSRLNRVVIAVMALLVVEIFELADGFGIMANVYDPFDYLANALGVALAYSVDVVSARFIRAD